MAWLARLDTRARQWPRPVFWGYTALKWYLVAVGAWMFIYAWSQNAITQGLLRNLRWP